MIESLYNKFLGLTSDPGAAATLVLAEVLATKEPKWLDIKQAAAKLGIGTTKMYALISAGAVKHKRIGRQIKIASDDLGDVSTTVSDRIATLEKCFQ
jgi:excisionase family DNA binding protein